MAAKLTNEEIITWASASDIVSEFSDFQGTDEEQRLALQAATEAVRTERVGQLGIMLGQVITERWKTTREELTAAQTNLSILNGLLKKMGEDVIDTPVELPPLDFETSLPSYELNLQGVTVREALQGSTNPRYKSLRDQVITIVPEIDARLAGRITGHLVRGTLRRPTTQRGTPWENELFAYVPEAKVLYKGGRLTLKDEIDLLDAVGEKTAHAILLFFQRSALFTLKG